MTLKHQWQPSKSSRLPFDFLFAFPVCFCETQGTNSGRKPKKYQLSVGQHLVKGDDMPCLHTAA